MSVKRAKSLESHFRLIRTFYPIFWSQAGRIPVPSEIAFKDINAF